MFNKCCECSKIVLPFTRSPLVSDRSSIHKSCHFKRLCNIVEGDDKHYVAHMTRELIARGVFSQILKYGGEG